MSLYILRWNPKISSYKTEHHLDLVKHIKNNEQPTDFDWSIREPEKLKKDDLFILQQVGTDHDGIAMIGKFKDECYEGDSWRKDGSKLYYADMWIMDAFDCDSDNPLPAKRYEKLFPEIKWHGGHSGVLVEDSLADELLKAIQKDMIKAGNWDEDELDDFIEWDFNQEQPVLDRERPTAEELADGQILLSLKEKYIEDSTDQNLIQVMCCLRDSVVRVPMHIEISEEDKKKIQENLEKGIDEGEFNGNARFYPMMITNDEGEQGFPVFSNEDEIGDRYEDADCGIYEIPFLECIDFAKDIEGCKVLVLDAFTKPLVITMELADVISQLKYQDESDDDEESDGDEEEE